MNNHTFTAAENCDALSFAHAMGLASEPETVSSELGDALSFAYAMGLKKRPVREKKEKAVSRSLFIPELRFN